METAVRQLTAVWGALLASIILYVFIGERITHTAPRMGMLFFQVIAAVALLTVAMIFVLRRVMIAKAVEILAAQPNEAQAVGRWRGGYMATFALCEAIALYGFLLRVQGFILKEVFPFYLAGAILLLFFAPRRPRTASA
jgi:hypothetical protein